MQTQIALIGANAPSDTNPTERDETPPLRAGARVQWNTYPPGRDWPVTRTGQVWDLAPIRAGYTEAAWVIPDDVTVGDLSPVYVGRSSVDRSVPDLFNPQIGPARGELSEEA